MRKVAFTSGQATVRKVMIYESSEGVFVFSYDCLEDSVSIFDFLHDTLDDAEDFCKAQFNLVSDDWILISDPLPTCQHDFILPTRVKGQENGNPEWGCFQKLVDDRWDDIDTLGKTQSFSGMTVNERLVLSGLISEFDKSKISDKLKAKQILLALQVDQLSIERIIE